MIHRFDRTIRQAVLAVAGAVLLFPASLTHAVELRQGHAAQVAHVANIATPNSAVSTSHRGPTQTLQDSKRVSQDSQCIIVPPPSAPRPTISARDQQALAFCYSAPKHVIELPGTPPPRA